MRFRFKSLRTEIIIILCFMTVLTITVLGGTSFIELEKSQKEALTNYQTATMDGYRTEIKSQVQSGMTIIRGAYNQYKSGRYTEEEAKMIAKESIRDMRYRDDASGYMWIDDTSYNLIMHPILKEQEGNNRKDLTDQNGVKIIQNIMTSAKSGGGYNEFYFTKADGVTVAPKLAYSEMFEPWGWVITTGNYIDDMQANMDAMEESMDADFAKMNIKLGVGIIVLLLIAISGSTAFGLLLVKVINDVKNKLHYISDGKLNIELPEKLDSRKDELGVIARTVHEVQDSLKHMIGMIDTISEKIGVSTNDFMNSLSEISSGVDNINAAVEEIAEGATNQSQDAEIVNTKVIELEQSIDIVKSMMDKLRTIFDKLRTLTDDMLGNINSLNDLSVQTNNAVGFVKDQTLKTDLSVKSINDAIGVISDIADQTNLLSLNASIEAAHAGDMGKGFAVVASEIRKLSDESAKNTSVITNIVDELTQNSSLSVEKIQDMTSNIETQMETLKLTISTFDSLYDEMKEAGQVTDEIGNQTDILTDVKNTVTDAVTNLASVTQESAAATEETSASMQVLTSNMNACNDMGMQLLQLSDELKDEITKFEL